MTAVGLGQRLSQAVGLGFEYWGSSLCRAKYFLRFIPNIFRYPNLLNYQRIHLRTFSGLRQKTFDGIS